MNKLILTGVGVTIFTVWMNLPQSATAKSAVETGPAKFLRSEAQALKHANQSDKPVFAFFQEVPG